MRMREAHPRLVSNLEQLTSPGCFVVERNEGTCRTWTRVLPARTVGIEGGRRSREILAKYFKPSNGPQAVIAYREKCIGQQ